MTAVLLLGSVLSAVPASATGATGSATGPGISAPTPKTPAPPAGLPVLDNSLDANNGASTDEAGSAAAKQAHTSGKPVAVDALTTETQQVMASPKGGFTLTTNPLPVRTKQAGTWVPVNTTLRRNANGTFSPVATAYGAVTFSGGGTAPAATTTSGATTYSLSWPGRLPAPTVSGSTLTYADVLPGVDLLLSATVAGGFTDVLVVKTAAAAHNPALTTLRLPTSVTGGKVTAGPDGGVTVTAASGNRSLVASTSTMWDSNTSLTTAAGSNNGKAAPNVPQGTKIAPDASDAGHPGLAARVAVVGAKADAGSLTLTPDAGLLTGRPTVFPVYIDPSFSWHFADSATPGFDEVKQGAPCNNVSLFNNSGVDGDSGFLGVGVNAWNSCIGTMRAYYQFALPSSIWGASINLATVNATKAYSAACSATTTVDLHWTGGIGGGTSWNSQPSYGGSIASAPFGPSYNPTYCPNNGWVANGFNVTGAIAQNAAGNASQFTIALADDGGEGSRNSSGFSRFTDNPTLEIQYNHAPKTPSSLSAVTGADNAGCAASQPYPFIGRTIQANTPVLRATVTDPDSDQLQATFKYWVDGSSTTASGVSAPNVGSGTGAAFSLPWSFVSGLSNGQVVDWQADVTDGQATSAWSQTCHFIAQPDPPLKPTIASADGLYPNSSTGGNAITPAQKPGKFTIATPSASATHMVYALDQPPAPTNPPASAVQPVTGVGGLAATPAGHWGLTDGSGSSAADTGGSHPVALAGGASWGTDATRGGVLTLDGSTGYGATAAPVLTTSSSYSVSAWVKINNTNNFYTVASQGGTNAGSFYLQYSKTYNAWTFTSPSSDSATPTSFQAVHAAGAPAINAWTHLVGVFDSSTHLMTLYVNGTSVGTATNTSAWDAAGPLSIGASKLAGGAVGNNVAGQISDVQVYQRALTPADVGSIYTATTVSVVPKWPGPHNLYAYAEDAAGDISETFDYPFLVASDVSTPCASLAACMNNTATSAGTGHTGAIDGVNSMSAKDLSDAGWQPGGTVTVDGANFTVPQFGTGANDNVLAADQKIANTDPALAAYNSTVNKVTGISSLMFLATSTNTPTETPGLLPGDDTAPFVPAGVQVASRYCFDSVDPAAMCAPIGTVTYTDGSFAPFYLTVPDWITGPASLASVVLPHENTSAGQNSAVNPRIYAFSVPLAPGETIQSVNLPDVGAQTAAGQEALHIFGMSTRSGVANVGAPSNENWTGAWAGATEGSYNLESGANYANQTFRVAVKPSLSGNSVRIKLDNALGTSALSIGHATIALDTPATGANPPSSVPIGTPTNLSFGGKAAVTVPEGGMVYSDPLPFTVAANQYLLVSFQLSNSVPFLVQHSLASDAYEYISPIGSGDRTADTTGTAFTGSGVHQGDLTNLVTGVDVATAVNAATSTGTPTQAILGDGLIDAWQPNTVPNIVSGSRMSDNLDGAEPSTPSPAGTIAEGIESNEVTADNAQTYAGSIVGGPSALSRVDRDILDQPNLSTVVLDEGLQDVLAGSNTVKLENSYAALLSYLEAYGINVVIVGLTPCDGYNGSGASPNDPCTAPVDGARGAVNSWLADTNEPYIDPNSTVGVSDASNGEHKLNPSADAGDHVNLSNAGYAALASEYLSPQDVWSLADGATDASGAATTTTVDSASSLSSYWAQKTPVGANPATLSGATSWVNDASHGQVLALDGATGYAATANPVLSTTGSFTVSGWANLTSTGHNATVVSQDGTQNSGFALQYDAADNRWAFGMAASDKAGATTTRALSAAAPATGTWTHLVGSYNANTHLLSLYVNGALVGTATDNTPWAATGALALGRGKAAGTATDFFPGELSGVEAFNYALTGPQITALYQRI